MKKYVLILCALLLVLCAAGCGETAVPPAEQPDPEPQTTLPPAPPTVLAADGQGCYTIIRADAATPEFIRLVSDFKLTMDSSTGVDFPFETDFYNPWMEQPAFPDPEILVGMTNRPETAEVLAALPDNSYTITRRGNKLVILGSEPSLTVMALDRFMATVLQNPDRCTDGGLIFTAEDEITAAFPVSHYFVRGAEAAENVVRSVDALRQQLNTAANTHFPHLTDADFADGRHPEILVGETNRPETAAVLAALPANSYTAALQGDSIVIVGTEPNLTVMALRRFAETVLQSPERSADGRLVFTEADTFTVTFDGPLTCADLLASGCAIGVESVLCAQSAPYSDNIRVAQGAASDGTYAYFVIRHVNDLGAVIAKHRLDNGERVAVSEVISVGHGNDATFDTANNRLIIAHGQSQGKMLTVVNPDTLKVEQVLDIPAGSGAISYSTAKNRYAISQGGTTLHFLDADFKLLGSFSRQRDTGYTAQGMGSDEEYLYFPMSGSNDNILEVYDWAGEYVTTVHVPCAYEAESMFWVNGEYYMAYNRSGRSLPSAELHRLIFSITYAG